MADTSGLHYYYVQSKNIAPNVSNVERVDAIAVGIPAKQWNSEFSGYVEGEGQRKLVS